MSVKLFIILAGLLACLSVACAAPQGSSSDVQDSQVLSSVVVQDSQVLSDYEPDGGPSVREFCEQHPILAMYTCWLLNGYLYVESVANAN